ncbi:hypothetical protein AVHY2522_18430 [Acidovorax sp. SUPP2522]|uniref:hypothetical protein n=1 Tax=unclassified Acidovorax TaxID=2684926 RepID=UPI00234A7DE8|nr:MULTISPECIES: hypothetical protein [unclassified Acidovorax]WCM96376.1 hypothetical protein M5C96_18335 [Acidovorax sp. GBBC 1281]GKT18342.1 hypothetical protein AVHY2522_18430 [Acidovorax sp. SUPP2522]
MAIAIFTGILKELGPSVQEAGERFGSTVYSYIELGDGQMLRNVSVVGGLDGKLGAALDSGESVELHVMQGGKKTDLLVAVRGGDGKLFATDLGGSSVMGYAMVMGIMILGLGLVPLFGVGLVFLWAGWRSWHGIRLVDLARKHVRALPGAILV